LIRQSISVNLGGLLQASFAWNNSSLYRK